MIHVLRNVIFRTSDFLRARPPDFFNREADKVGESADTTTNPNPIRNATKYVFTHTDNMRQIILSCYVKT